VAQFVLNDDTEEGQLGNAHFLARAHNIVRVSDAADVLHRAVLVIRGHHMVNFSEWVTCSEIFLIKVKSRFGNTKHKFMAQIFNE